MDRKAIKAEAKKIAFENKWNVWKLVLCIGLVGGIVSYVLGLFGETQVCTDTFTCETTPYGTFISIITSILSYVLAVASATYTLDLVRTGKPATLEKCIDVIKKNILVILGFSALTYLNVTIGYMLLLVPGIMAAMGLGLISMVYYDNQNLTTIEVLKKTWELMKGHKWEYFVFNLSFILWYLACIVLVPIIWVIPYTTIAVSVYYDKVIKK